MRGVKRRPGPEREEDEGVVVMEEVRAIGEASSRIGVTECLLEVAGRLSAMGLIEGGIFHGLNEGEKQRPGEIGPLMLCLRTNLGVPGEGERVRVCGRSWRAALV